MIELLAFAGLAIAVAHLWSRLANLELRLAEAEYRLASPPEYPEPDAADPGAMPSPPATTDILPEAVGGSPAEPATASPSPWQPVPGPVAEPVSAPWRLPAAPADSPLPEPPSEEPAPAGAGFGFEELFGRRLPIWAGGVTLAVAGVLIVRYSIEAGLLSPLVRFLSGLAFGTGLIAAAEAALRLEERLRDPRVRQALAGAGIASLYASILVAANVYALIGPLAAFLGMAAVTALAMALSLRFGAPSALLGLAGGLAAPALVGAGEPNVPLLSIYLALAVGGLCLLSRVQRWMWLGVSAIAGGLGWGAVLLLGGALDAASSISIGIYVLLVGIALPLLALPGAVGGLLRIGGSIVAAAQIAALVATGGFTLLHWGLFGTISIAIVWLARREKSFERVPVVGLGIALLLAGAWPEPEPAHFALVLVAAACIYGIPALLTLWRPRGSLVEAGEIAALSLGVTILSAFHYYRADHSMDLALAAVAIAAAVLPAVGAMLGWRDERRGEDARFALLCSTVALQLGLAAGFAAPTVTLPLIVAAIGLALLLLSRRSGDIRLEHSAWLFAAAALPLLAAAPMAEAETLRLAGKAAPVDQAVAVLRWGILALLAALFAWRARLEVGRGAAQVAAALLAYGAAAQLVPGDWLALVPPLGLLGLTLAGRSVGFGRLIPAMAVPLTLAFLWAGAPLFAWVDSAVPSIGGVPVLVSDLPALRETLLRLLAPALLILTALGVVGTGMAREARVAAAALGAVLAAVAAHILFKQLFAIGSHEAFVAAGFAERTLWQGLIMAAALAAWRLRYRRAALGLSVAALAHFGWYSMLLHNPLWAEQAVGRLPLLSLLLPAYGLPLAWLWLVGRHEPKLAERTGRAREIMQMLLITLLAFSMLRQLAEGSLLAGPGLAPAEDIARSILAAALAIAFLLWGIATGSRDRRIFSLVLMLGAVAKVFLLDASGLEGLMRIASFVALGLSLIGIGWLYSRSFAGERPLTGLR